MQNGMPVFGSGILAPCIRWKYVRCSSVCGQFFDWSGRIWSVGCLTIVAGATVAALMHGETTRINIKKTKIFAITRMVIHKDTQDYPRRWHPKKQKK